MQKLYYVASSENSGEIETEEICSIAAGKRDFGLSEFARVLINSTQVSSRELVFGQASVCGGRRRGERGPWHLVLD